MMAKSEIALLTVTVVGTLGAWLTVQHPSFVSPSDGEPNIECRAPVAAVRSVEPPFAGEQASLGQAARILRTLQQRETMQGGGVHSAVMRRQAAGE
jgi:hypothetical protein